MKPHREAAGLAAGAAFRGRAQQNSDRRRVLPPEITQGFTLTKASVHLKIQLKMIFVHTRRCQDFPWMAISVTKALSSATTVPLPVSGPREIFGLVFRGIIERIES